MMFSALAFLAGVLLVQQFPELPNDGVIATCVGVALVFAYWRYWRACLVLVGVVWAIAFAMYRLADQLSPDLAGVDLTVQGIVVDLPQHNEKHVRFDFAPTPLTPPMLQLPSKLRLSWYYPEAKLKAGQRWTFTVRLKPPHGNLNPGGFDYERWLFTEGIGATGYVRPNPKPNFMGMAGSGSRLAIWRQAITDQLSPDCHHYGLLKALTIGDANCIFPTEWEVFRKTGTTHLMVISGSHIALVAGLVYLLMRRIWVWLGVLSWSPQRVAAWLALFSGIAYAGLAGFSIPTQRAVIMLFMVMLTIIQQRHSQPFNILAVALLAVLVFDPLAVLSPGFWLSFLAVALIIYVSAGRLGKFSGWVEALRINWATSLGLAPLLLLFFQQMALSAPLANFIAVPVISFLIVPGALFAVLLLPVWRVGADFLFFWLDYVLQALYGLLEQLATLPFAVLNHPQPPFWTLVLAIPGILLLLAPKGMLARWSGCLMLLPMAFTMPEKPALGELSFTLLDVGQGLSVVVQTAEHCLVFDTGAKFSADSDRGQTVVLPFLRLQGIHKLDQLIISHGDNDHIGGTASLLREIPTEQLFSSVPEQLSDYGSMPCRAGQSWTWDEVNFTMLSPDSRLLTSDNDSSCVLKITTAYGSLLLTGDIEAGAESWLLDNQRDKLQSDVLLAPHHGSNTSSTLPFLKAVQPKMVLIPSGYRNQFGHPHPAVLNRYQQLDIKWLSSANSGAVQVLINKIGLTVTSQRQEFAKYWQSRERAIWNSTFLTVDEKQ